MATIWLFLVALASLFHYFLTKRRRETEAKHLQLPPGPKKLPIIGNLHHLSELGHQSLWQLSQKHGPVIYLQLGSMPTVVVSSAEMAREAMKTRDLDFCSRPKLAAADKLFYHQMDVGFSEYNEYWRIIRKICIVELFSIKRVQSFHFVRKEEVDFMIQTIASSASRPINLSQILVNLANDIICRIAYGRRYRDGEHVKNDEVHEVLQESQALLGGFFVADYFPWLGWIDRLNGMAKRLGKNASKLDAFYEQVIQEHLDLKKMKPEHEDIVDILLKLKKENDHLTNHNIKAIITDLFFGGTETASSTIVWAMTELARNPTLMNKVQDDIRTSVGKKGRVEETDLHKLHLLKAVIKETFRLHPPLALLIPRESIRRSKLGGYDIPPNIRVYINAWGIGRDPNSWEKPLEFVPERFMGSPIDFHGHDFELIPFGSGRRICPAINFAAAVIELALANLLYTFDWKLPAGMKPEDINLDETPGLVVRKKFPMYLAAIKYKGA